MSTQMPNQLVKQGTLPSELLCGTFSSIPTIKNFLLLVELKLVLGEYKDHFLGICLAVEFLGHLLTL